MAIENNLNFRAVVDKTEPHTITDELIIQDGNNQSYLLEAIEYSDGSYAQVTLTDGNNNQLIEDTDYTLLQDTGLITFLTDPIPPVKANYTGVGSIIWAHDIRELQNAITGINENALDKTGDTLQGQLNVNGFNLANVSTINNIQLWTHDHTSGNGNLIPTNGIEDSAITTSKILDKNVTSDKLSEKENGGVAAVATKNIQDGAVTNNEIADRTIENGKIKDNTIQNSKLKDSTIKAAKLDLKDLIDTLYPIGSIYIGLQDTCPLAKFGTTWQKITDGYYLQQKLPNKSLGELVGAGLPNITGSFETHTWKDFLGQRGAFNIYKENTDKRSIGHGGDYFSTWNDFDASKGGSNLYGKSDTVQTNAIEVNIWKRIL